MHPSQLESILAQRRARPAIRTPAQAVALADIPPFVEQDNPWELDLTAPNYRSGMGRDPYMDAPAFRMPSPGRVRAAQEMVLDMEALDLMPSEAQRRETMRRGELGRDMDFTSTLLNPVTGSFIPNPLLWGGAKIHEGARNYTAGALDRAGMPVPEGMQVDADIYGDLAASELGKFGRTASAVGQGARDLALGSLPILMPEYDFDLSAPASVAAAAPPQPGRAGTQPDVSGVGAGTDTNADSQFVGETPLELDLSPSGPPLSDLYAELGLQPGPGMMLNARDADMRNVRDGSGISVDPADFETWRRSGGLENWMDSGENVGMDRGLMGVRNPDGTLTELDLMEFERSTDPLTIAANEIASNLGSSQAGSLWEAKMRAQQEEARMNQRLAEEFGRTGSPQLDIPEGLDLSDMTVTVGPDGVPRTVSRFAPPQAPEERRAPDPKSLTASFKEQRNEVLSPLALDEAQLIIENYQYSDNPAADLNNAASALARAYLGEEVGSQVRDLNSFQELAQNGVIPSNLASFIRNMLDSLDNMQKAR